MMSLAVIQQLSDAQARKAARVKRRPYVPFDVEEVDRMETFPFPNIGSYKPAGWRKVADWFVDKTGWGAEDEPALTLNQFRAAVREWVEKHPGDGFAITEEGQFQIYVSAFRKRSRK
jgi:hypothetical protein